jgi:hypothetical protein
MSKEKNIKQMSLLEDSHANHFQSQEKEKEQMTIDTSGMKLLESSENANRSILLAKMLKVLLTSNKAWYSDRCKLIWKKKVSKSNVLLYQLQASVLGIKEKEFGLSDVMYPTPTSQDHSRNTVPPSIGKTRGMDLSMRVVADQMRMYPTPTQDSASERTKKYKQGGTPLPLAVKMYPTPTVGCEEGGEQSERVEQTKSGGFILRKKNNPQMTFGAKLSDAMIYLEKNKIYNTPTTNDAKNLTFPQSQKNRNSIIGNTIQQQKIKPGGKLNPNFVEFLMGYPINWTKIEPTESKHLETQLSHKSPENLEKQLSKQKMYRTPTSMDINEDSMIYAAKILKGKVNRNSNQRVQITLSTDVAMEYLKNNPHLINEFDKPFMERPNLPNKLDFINYLKSQTTIKELVQKTNLSKTKIEHWFRKDNCFSYPSIEDWNIIKPFLKELKFDKELTYQIEKDWKE